MTAMLGDNGEAGVLRAGLLFLAVLGVAGSALALAYERHWQSTWQLAPWITLAIIIVAVGAVVVRPGNATVWLARTVAVLAIVSAALGVWQHIDGNYNSATATETDHHGEETSTGPSFGEVVTGGAGHAPVPAALAIAPVGLALGLATIGLGRPRRQAPE